jgi:hypothetical protein
MKGVLAWLVRNDDGEWEVILDAPSRYNSYTEIKQIVYFEVEEKN